jgi:L-ascorbate metabolism protein UlaG (beta-lactamase superfamily)
MTRDDPTPAPRQAPFFAARYSPTSVLLNGVFQNPVETQKVGPGRLWRALWHQVTGREQRVPPRPPVIKRLTASDVGTLPASGLRATWLGHSTTLHEVDGVRVLVDPVWAERVSPIAFAGPRRFHPPPIALADLPPLDAVVISHDHYDHLDSAVVRALVADPGRAPLHFIVPFGVGAHLERWGVRPARITELEWGESTKLDTDTSTLTITATPARHFSGRGIGDVFGLGDRTLWSSWVFTGPRRRVFFSGDTGPFDGLADIGLHYGPFDLTLIGLGAYSPMWPDVHMTPEQAIAAHQMLRGRVLLPIHWGTFNLAFHAWDEPIERALIAARRAGVRLALPRPGESIEPDGGVPAETWWRSGARSAAQGVSVQRPRATATAMAAANAQQR